MSQKIDPEKLLKELTKDIDDVFEQWLDPDLNNIPDVKRELKVMFRLLRLSHADNKRLVEKCNKLASELVQMIEKNRQLQLQLQRRRKQK